jgi:ParB-like chromosome segregation protein Spo0J
MTAIKSFKQMRLDGDTKRGEAIQALSAVELCAVYTQLLAFKWTPAQIAELLGKPTAHVKMILDLAGGNTDVHAMVQAKAVSPTIAAETVRKHGDAAGSVLKDQLATAQAAGKSKVTAATTKPKVSRPTEALWCELFDALEDAGIHVTDQEWALPIKNIMRQIDAIYDGVDVP